MTRRFTQVDVFGSGPLLGNPLAVVHDAEGLADADLAAFARWTNLSETTFLLPPRDPAADYRVRIFTPVEELPFAGHPTLGSAHAWLAAGGRPAAPDRIVQECGAGLIPVRRTDRLAFAAPPLLRSGPLSGAELATVSAALQVRPETILAAAWVDNGPGWVGVQLASAADVLALEPDWSAFGGLETGVIGRYPDSEAAALGALVEVRAFCPSMGAVEDPVTGSLNASLAQWLIGNQTLPSSYVASQGTRIGRRGRVWLDRRGDTVWVGGATTTVLTGTVDL